MKGRALQERSQPDGSRRNVVAALGSGSFAGLAGWRTLRAGVGEEPWEVAGNRSFVLRSCTSFDLNTTLPRTMSRGGEFEVDPVGSPLPPATRLSRSGVLTVGLVDEVDADGVVFRCTQPD